MNFNSLNFNAGYLLCNIIVYLVIKYNLVVLAKSLYMHFLIIMGAFVYNYLIPNCFLPT
jgi:hypothetical protein